MKHMNGKYKCNTRNSSSCHFVTAANLELFCSSSETHDAVQLKRFKFVEKKFGSVMGMQHETVSVADTQTQLATYRVLQINVTSTRGGGLSMVIT